uniref:Glycosyltransferase family 1 protein n=1 Tax=candidate division CPR3 bacterium TaxID=2268181 RepID=A0A7C5URB8_UNCC3
MLSLTKREKTIHTRRILNVGIATKFPREHYSRKFVCGFYNLPIIFYVLSKKGEQSLPENNTEIVPCWTSYFYPVQIVLSSIKQRVHIIHIQHEFNMFGSIFTILLSPILLFLVKYLTRKPCVTTLHTVLDPEWITHKFIKEMYGKLGFVVPPFIVKIVLSYVYYFTCRFSDVIIVHSPSHIFVLQKYGVDKRKIFFVPHGIETTSNNYNVDLENKWRNIIQGNKVILFFGYIVPRKGLEVLLDAFKKVLEKEKHTKLILAGGIRKEYVWYYKQLKEKISHDNLSSFVLFTGYIPTKEIPILYSLSDVLVLPYTYPVGNSSPAMYAIQFEKPLVATNIFPFIDEFKNGADALLVKPFNSSELADAIIKLLQNDELRRKLSENIKRKKTNRDWSSIAKIVFEKVYLKIIHS